MVLNASTIALMILFSVLATGYMIGRINIKGVRLGSSGVFIVAVIFSCILGVIEFANKNSIVAPLTSLSKNFQSIGLVLFITAIGFTAGPVFIKTIKNGALNFLLISVIVVIVGLGSTLLFYFLDPNLDMPSALGLMMGSLTSTPGLSSTQSAFMELEIIDITHAISYPFGVLGACLFAQIVPKFFKKNLEESKAKLHSQSANEESSVDKKNDLIEIDKMGLGMFSLAGVLGILIGGLTIPGINFKLTTTGGCLIAGVLFSQIKKVGKISLSVPKATLGIMKELGLVMFLAGAGITGGLNFIPTVREFPLFFVYGIVITLMPMIIGFILAHKVFKMDILTNLGAITGAMTSTPALGALEQVAESDDVSACYTATYPLALFLLVVIPQIIKIFM